MITSDKHNKIYHYTSIENLALILNSKKIRFSRLDTVDDILESTEYKELGLQKYTFVSCWTEVEEENIALWKMYTPNMKGVRVSVSYSPFKLKLVKQNPNFPAEIIGEKYLPFTLEECHSKDYFILPIFEDGFFYKKIEYLNDEELKSRYNNIIANRGNEKSFNYSIKLGDLGKIKHERWSFQNESRFVLMILPPTEELHNVSKMSNQIINGEPLPFSYFDVELSDSFFDEIEVTMGPNCNDSDEIILKSLLNQYGVSKQLKKSSLRNIIRK